MVNASSYPAHLPTSLALWAASFGSCWVGLSPAASFEVDNGPCSASIKLSIRFALLLPSILEGEDAAEEEEVVEVEEVEEGVMCKGELVSSTGMHNPKEEGGGVARPGGDAPPFCR